MKVTLKKIVYSEALSQETNAFTADVYIDGKLVGYARNNGCGGSTFVMAHDRILLEAAESYFAALPPKPYTHGDRTFELPISLDGMVDEALEDYLNQKHIKKMEKDMVKGIIHGGKYGYTLISWANLTLQQMLDSPTGKVKVINEIQKLNVSGKTILNTNIPKEILVAVL